MNLEVVLEHEFAVIAAEQAYRDFSLLGNYANQNLYALCTTIILFKPVADYYVESFRGTQLVKKQFYIKQNCRNDTSMNVLHVSLFINS